ncbi:phage tail protein [Terribacillus saccharophilus]|uniref:phage tail protein n=1 Tax=Terribacillus saccharophilus TaxID=361277 RepID=UPI003D277763
MSVLDLVSASIGTEPISDVSDLIRKRTTDGTYEISFYVTRTQRNTDIFDAIVNEAYLELDGELFIIGETSRNPVGTTVEKYVRAQHEMFNKLRTFIETSRTGALRLNACLNIALAGSGLTYEIIGDFPSEQFENFGQDTGIKLLETIVDRFEVEYRVVGKHLVFAKEIARYTDDHFSHGHNLTAIEENVNTDDVRTFIKGFGAIDEDTGQYVVTAEYESPYSNRYTDENGNKRLLYAEYVYDERFTNYASLLAELKRRLTDTPEYNLTITYEELKRNGFTLYDFQLGDYVWVKYEPLNLDLQVRIISVEDYPLDSDKSPVIELGNFNVSYVGALANANKAVQNQSVQISTVTVNITKAQAEAKKASDAAAAVQQRLETEEGSWAGHINNSDIHVTPQNKLAWNDHIEDDAIHVSQTDRDKWNAAADPDGSAELALKIARLRGRKVHRMLYAGNKTITLPFSYEPGKNQLDVRVEYLSRISGSSGTLPAGMTADYLETSATSITFTDAMNPPNGTYIEIFIADKDVT